MTKKLSAKAFSFLELSIVILIIGLLISAFLGGAEISGDAKLRQAKNLTQNSPVVSLPGLVFWLDTTSEKSFSESEAKDGALISKWFDLNPEASVTSYLSNNSVTASDHPSYTEGCINGLPCLYFNGTASKITATKSLGVRTKYVSAFFVFTGSENSNGTSFNFFNSDKNAAWDIASGVFIFGGTAGQNFFYNMPSSYGVQSTVCNNAANLAAKQPYVYSVVDNYTASISHYVNGSVANSSVGNGSVTKFFGAVEIGQGSYKGGVGEVILFSTALSNADRKAVEQYLGKKWGIQVNP